MTMLTHLNSLYGYKQRLQYSHIRESSQQLTMRDAQSKACSHCITELRYWTSLEAMKHSVDSLVQSTLCHVVAPIAEQIVKILHQRMYLSWWPIPD